MGYHVTHWTGETVDELPFGRFGELIDSLRTADRPTSDVSLMHDSACCLTIFRGRIAVITKREGSEPVHAGPMSRDELVEIMRDVAEGKIASVLGSREWA